MLHRRFTEVAVVACCSMLAGCLTAPGPVTVPMDSLSHAGSASAGIEPNEKCLLLFFPGYGDRQDAFEKHGFVEKVRAAGINADMIALDAHYGYYEQGIVLRRVYEDFLVPARTKGYPRIWAVGISMGGAGTLGTAAAFPGRIDGILLLAPAVYDASLVSEIFSAGGLKNWDPGPNFAPAQYLGQPESAEPYWQEDRRSFFRYLMSWIKTRPRPDGTKVPVYLGYGESDRHAETAAMVGEVLPPENVMSTKGGHNWEAWSKLFDRFLKESSLSKSCGGSAAES